MGPPSIATPCARHSVRSTGSIAASTGRTSAWMDYQIKWMWSKQDSAHRPHLEKWRGRGIVEGWYGDGNFNRTSLMYAMWKTQGVSAHPWRADLRYGAVRRGDSLFVVVEAYSAWSGALRFDTPRHRDVLH